MSHLFLTVYRRRRVGYGLSSCLLAFGIFNFMFCGRCCCRCRSYCWISLKHDKHFSWIRFVEGVCDQKIKKKSKKTKKDKRKNHSYIKLLIRFILHCLRIGIGDSIQHLGNSYGGYRCSEQQNSNINWRWGQLK